MPQLVKGGKYVFGLALIRENYQIQIPPEAFDEYALAKTDIIVILSGSKTSGGFGIHTPKRIRESKIYKILEHLQYDQYSNRFNIPVYTIKNMNQRMISWTNIHKNGLFSLNDQLAKQLHISIGDKLVVARGSNMGSGFISKGPIFKEAMQHLELGTF